MNMVICDNPDMRIKAIKQALRFIFFCKTTYKYDIR